MQENHFIGQDKARGDDFQLRAGKRKNSRTKDETKKCAEKCPVKYLIDNLALPPGFVEMLSGI